MSSTGTILGLAWRSLLNRKGTALVTVFAIAVSVALLIGVERIRGEARTSFANTISGTDLIVGARSGPINLLLYSVFRIGNATNNISWESYERWASNPQVQWTIPLSLGDSHRGYRVLGTTGAYFEHYRFARDRGLEFSAGKPFEAELDAVVGADVARELGYSVGDEIVVSHGIGATSFVHHDDKPFTVTGILAKTGTPVDRTVHVSLAGIDAMHEGWPDAGTGGAAVPPAMGARVPAPAKPLPSVAEDDHDHDDEHDHEGADHDHDGDHDHEGADHDHDDEYDHAAADHDHDDEHDHEGADHDHEAGAITAFLVGLNSRIATLQVQRNINEDENEALMAIIPGVALQELWGLVGIVETALLAVSAFVVLAGLLGMLSALLTSLNERRREMAILRAVGARPWHVLALLVLEAGLLAFSGAALGVLAVYGLIWGLSPVAETAFGVFIGAAAPGLFDALIVGAVTAAGLLIGLIPAWRAYRNTLIDGLQIRV